MFLALIFLIFNFLYIAFFSKFASYFFYILFISTVVYRCKNAFKIGKLFII